MSGNLVKHGDFPVELAEKELADIDRGNADFMKLVVGRNVVRFLPPKIGKQAFTKVLEHFVRIPGVQRPAVFVCPSSHAKQRCPACDKAAQLRTSGNPADRDAAYEFSAKMRVYASVIDRRSPESGPKVVAFGKSIWEQLLKLRKDQDAGGDFTDPLGGFDIIIERAGTGKNDTEYTVNGSRKTSPLHANQEQANEWIEGQADLERFMKLRGYDELKQAMSGGSDAQPTQAGRVRGKDPGTSAPRKRTADADVGAGGDPDDDIAF